MPAVSSEKRDEFLRSFGTSSKDVYETDEPTEETKSNVSEEQEQVESSAAEEVEEPQEATEESEEAEGEEEFDFDALSGELYPEEKVAGEESELSRLRQEVDLLKNLLSGKVSEGEARVSGKAKEEAEEGEIDWSDPAIVGVFQKAGLDEDQAQAMAPLFGSIAKMVGERIVKKELAPLQTRVQEADEGSKLSALRSQIQQNLGLGVQRFEKDEGVEGFVVRDFMAKGAGSVLGKHLKQFPYKVSSPEGVQDAILSVSGAVRRKAAEKGVKLNLKPSEESSVRSKSKDEVTAALGKAKRSDSSTTNKKKLSPDEQIIAEMKAAGSKIKKLPKGFWG